MSTVDKFWLRMGQKFGKPWIDLRGTEPNEEWRNMVNRFPEKTVMDALDELPAKWDYPPTHPAMAAFLKAYAGKLMKGETNNVRNFWWAFVIGELMHCGFMAGHWRFHTDLYELHEPMRGRIRRAARRVFDDIIGKVETHNESVLMANIQRACEREIKALDMNTNDPTTDRYS